MKSRLPTVTLPGRRRWAAVLALIGVLILLDLAGVFQDQRQVPLASFVLGRWRCAPTLSDGGASSRPLCELEFVAPDVLVVHRSTGRGAEYNLKFEYQFVRDDRLRLGARLADEWVVQRRGAELLIESAGDVVRDGVYHRAVPVNGPLLGIAALWLALGALVWRPVSLWPATPWLGRLPRAVFAPLALLIGLMGLGLAYALLGQYPFQIIRLPWEAVVRLGLGAALLTWGIKVVRRIPNPARLADQRLHLLLGLFTAAAGAVGVVDGAIRLALYGAFGHYPFE